MNMQRFLIIMLGLPIAAATILTGCISKPVTPIPYLEYKRPESAVGNKKLLVFLRGFGGSHKIFEKHGLVKAVQDKGYPFDMIAPDAHMGYYKAETLGTRLYTDIIGPARKQGYKEIWLAGTSMGGLGAMIYLTDYPDTVDGVILLSPFLGWGDIIDEIKGSGGLRAWEPGPHTIEDWQRFLWAWIKNYDLATEKRPEIYLGYGDDDFFTESQELLGAVLPEGHTTVVDGGHTYSTLRKLWKHYMIDMEERFRK